MLVLQNFTIARENGMYPLFHAIEKFIVFASFLSLLEERFQSALKLEPATPALIQRQA